MSIRPAFRIPVSAARTRTGLAAGLLAFAAAAFLSACIAGGTGTDTENGFTENPNAFTGVAARVTDSAGAPLAGVSLRLFDPAYRPDRDPFPAPSVSNPPESLVSDTGGYVRLRLKAPGKFVVEGASGSAILFFDTLAVADAKQSAVYTFRARPSRRLQGRVKLASGMRIDSGRVFIRGTEEVALLDTLGRYDLGQLPADAIRMGLGVGYLSRPVAVLRAESEVAPIGADTSRSRLACRDTTPESFDPARTASVQPEPSASFDTASVIRSLQACDSLATGSVVKVAGGLPGTKGLPEAQETEFLVLEGTGKSGESSITVAAPVLVPLGRCVPSAGRESALFAVDARAAGASTDLVVGDVAAECLSR